MMGIHNPVTNMGVNASGDSEAITVVSGAAHVSDQAVAAGEQVSLDYRVTIPSGNASNITASAAVKSGAGVLSGFYVNNTTAGTLVIYDNTAASGTQISGTITPAIGWHTFPAEFGTGLYAVIANTLDVTFIYR